jgi:ATP-dependent DNA helicase RecG
MSRLIQGDVGSGKTMVAFAAILNVAEAGMQSVLMAPTDVLAKQLYENFQKYCQNLNIKNALLTGKTKTAARKNILAELEKGELKILFGTHAVFQDKVIFYDLALVVIDEQHRFGVNQRLALVNKGIDPDILVMSATPIPRSLALTLYGDMEISRINEKPKDRIAIKTSILPTSKIDQIITSLNKIIAENGKVFWVCPLVNQAEDNLTNKNNKTAAEERWQELSKNFPGKVGLIHGQLENNQKQQALDNFIEGQFNILVATTVIEVGVDVPDATVIIIENAESFGLAQLHQLRGRVGRGDKASHCILLYQAPISNTSWERLKIMRESDDGFLLAEHDLKHRGSGDVIGTKQSGLPNFKAVDFMSHHHLVALANQCAKTILGQDPWLEKESSQRYLSLLKIFGFDDENKNLKLLKS